MKTGDNFSVCRKFLRGGGLERLYGCDYAIDFEVLRGD